MGIEAALLALGASAGTAATVGTIGSVVGGLGALSSVSKLTKGAQQAPVQPVQTPTETVAKTQEAKTPDRAQSQATNAAAAVNASAGNSSTFLTGPSGVDPYTLVLGKSALLGQ